MKRIQTLATLVALALPTQIAAAPFCPALGDIDQLPSKYAKRGPFHADQTSGWIVGADQLKASFEVSEETTALWRAIHEEFARRGARLLVLSAPPRPLFAPQAALPPGADPLAMRAAYSAYIAELNTAGIAAPDLAEAAEQEIGDAFYFARDTHWTPKGAAWSALRFAEAAGMTPPDLSSLPFSETYQEKGSLSMVVEKTCGARPEPETVVAPVYAQPGGINSLLGDVADPSIALVGTSFSDRYKTDAYQVAGAISFAFGAEVENFSVTGGGLAGAMEAFVQSGALADGQFETVVWETPYTNPLTQVAGLRQILGALTAGGPEAQVYRGPLSDDWQAVKFDAPISPGATLTIETPGIDAGQLSVELFSSDGEKIRLKLRKSKRVEPDMRSDVWKLSLKSLPMSDVARIKLKLSEQTQAARVALIN